MTALHARYRTVPERRGCRSAIVACLWLALTASVQARTLADGLSLLVTENSFLFEGANFDALTPGLQRIASQGTDLPVTSTLPAVSYSLDLESGALLRASGPLTSVLLEQAETLGRRRLLIGVSYLHADLTRFDGNAAADGIFFANSAVGLDTATGHPVRVRNRLTFGDFGLQLDGVGVSATLGLSDAWDVNLLLPLLRTQLNVEARSQNSTRDLVDGTVAKDASRRVSFQDAAVGVGDVLLRTKYGFGRHCGIDGALSLVLRAPTGEAGDFHGLGDWTVTPLLVLSRGFERFHVHTNLGLQANADDLERSRVRYGAGSVLQPFERVALLVDLIGSVGVTTDRFDRDGLALGGSRFIGPFQRRVAVARGSTAGLAPVHFSSAVPRTHVLDLALGIKGNLSPSIVAFATVIVPLTPDGLRAEAIPSGGVELTF